MYRSEGFSQDEIEEVAKYYRLDHLAGLCEVNVLGMHFEGVHHAAIWVDCLQALEAFIRSQALRVRTLEQLEKMAGHDRLYPGSLVSATESKLAGPSRHAVRCVTSDGDIEGLESFGAMSFESA